MTFYNNKFDKIYANNDNNKESMQTKCYINPNLEYFIAKCKTFSFEFGWFLKHFQEKKQHPLLTCKA
jgi:hypothetical protein